MGVDVIGAGTERLVTKANTAGQYQIGSVTVAATAGTTAWSQVAASLAADTLITSVYATTTGAFDGTTILDYIEIGVGGSGAESSVGTAPLTHSAAGTDRQALARFDIPNRVASGQRLSIRLTAGAGLATANVTLYVYGVPYANLEGN